MTGRNATERWQEATVMEEQATAKMAVNDSETATKQLAR